VPVGEGGLRQPSVALYHQMRALDKLGLIDRWGTLPPDRMAEIERIVLRTLGVRH
jgi:mRNA-degrading endonuclease toxin of MazEF toxin-antitoxin module